jgi:polar amino acid transport system substrate-binding protein
VPRISAPPLTRALIAGLLVVLLAGCATAGGSPAASSDPDADVPRADVTSAVLPDPAAVALLPPEVRASGVLTVGASVGTPPSAFHLSDNRTAVGQDIDITEAMARALGLRVERTEATFDAVLPGLGSGRFEVGTGNFAVTEARKKIVDFVTYINDGQGFVVRADDPLPPVTDLTQLCGRTIGVGAGTTFETTLNRAAGECVARGLPPYTVNSYTENAAVFLSLQQRRSDAVMSTINGLRYAVSKQPRLRFVNEFRRLDVGFALARNSPLTPAVHAAMQRLIDDGTYSRILEKWGTSPSAVRSSEINPPETA